MNLLQWQDIESNNDKKSCWIVIKNTVYDVTQFLDQHPGGDEIILEKGGQDATKEFQNTGHSQDAYEMLKQYEIGVCRDGIQEKASIEKKTFQQIPVFFIGIILYAFIYYYCHKQNEFTQF